MAVGILAGFLLGAIAGNEAGRIQEQIWWKYVDQDRYIEEFLKRDEESFDVVIPRVSNSRMSDWDARFSEWCDFYRLMEFLSCARVGSLCPPCCFIKRKSENHWEPSGWRQKRLQAMIWTLKSGMKTGMNWENSVWNLTG